MSLYGRARWAIILLIGLFLANSSPVQAAEELAVGSPVKRLPVVELAVPESATDLLAIIFSGDGGWADLDRDFGKAFQKRGVATLGFDSFKYFWKARHPPEVSRDLESIVRYYLQAWHKKRLLLVSYSFGASWLPFLLNRLPADLQERVSLAVLLVPGPYANLEIKMGDWFRSDIQRPGALPVQPEAARIRHPLLCVYGREDESICQTLHGENFQSMVRPGGHHFDHDYDTIEQAILKKSGLLVGSRW